MVDETIEDLDLSIVNHFYIAYSGDEKALEKVSKQLKQHYPETPITRFSLGPTIASHTGYGCVALFSTGKTKRF